MVINEQNIFYNPPYSYYSYRLSNIAEVGTTFHSVWAANRAHCLPNADGDELRVSLHTVIIKNKVSILFCIHCKIDYYKER